MAATIDNLPDRLHADIEGKLELQCSEVFPLFLQSEAVQSIHQIPIDHSIQAVNRKSDAVICQAV